MKDRLTPSSAADLGLWAFFMPASLVRCDTCPAEVYLVTRRHDSRVACAECWKAAGSPFPRTPASPAEVLEAEQRTQKRMKARGGADRHLVNAGKA